MLKEDVARRALGKENLEEPPSVGQITHRVLVPKLFNCYANFMLMATKMTPRYDEQKDLYIFFHNSGLSCAYVNCKRTVT